MRPETRRSLIRLLLVAVPSLALATLVVAALQDVLGVPNPSAVYLVAVVAAAIASGTLGAIATSVAAFLLYNFLFTEPRYTLSMTDSSAWLSAILLLFVAVVVGQLTALQRARAEEAQQREREALALFSVSRTLVTRATVESVLPDIARALAASANMQEVVVTIGAETSPPAAERGVINQLRRYPGDTPPEWVRVHQPARQGRPRSEAGTASADVYRVLIESGGATLGSIWAIRPRDTGAPEADQTRLLAAAADQIGQAIAHDRMAAESHAAEIVQESDALKSALLQSVSHDLRTPLATIRAAAGTLRPGAHADEGARNASVEAIDREVEYLNRLVSNLLDLSRIEAGALRADTDTFELDDLVRSTLERLTGRLDDRQIVNDVAALPVAVDPVFFEATLSNVLENAARHTAAGATIRLSARALTGTALVRLTIEDSGPGVPDDALGRLFDKFYRVPGQRSSRSGTGIGLAVARGLVEAMGGTIAARRAELGGLAIDIDLRAAQVPAELAAVSSTPVADATPVAEA